MALTVLSVLALAASPALGHFTLAAPPTLGFDDTSEGSAPCGGFDPTNRSVVTDWPIGGYPVSVLTTHPQAMWAFRAADAAKPNMWMALQANVSQQGLGHVCYSAVPGMGMLMGKDAVVQIISTAVDGALYQCAAVKFVQGPAMKVPADCTNSSGVSASYVGGSQNSGAGMGMGGMDPNMPGMNMSGNGTTGSSTTGGTKSAGNSVISEQNLPMILGTVMLATALFVFA